MAEEARVETTGCRAFPPFLYSLRVAKGGRNNLKEEITPSLLPTGIGERYSQTLQNLGHASLFLRCELPIETKCWTNSGPSS